MEQGDGTAMAWPVLLHTVGCEFETAERRLQLEEKNDPRKVIKSGLRDADATREKQMHVVPLPLSLSPASTAIDTSSFRTSEEEQPGPRG